MLGKIKTVAQMVAIPMLPVLESFWESIAGNWEAGWCGSLRCLTLWSIGCFLRIASPESLRAAKVIDCHDAPKSRLRFGRIRRKRKVQFG